MNVLAEKQKDNLKLGYCCLNSRLRELGIFCSRTCRLNTLQKNGIEHSYNLAMQNLKDLACILRWNHNNGIYLYRMSSEMFPFASHPNYYEHYDFTRFEDILKTIGVLAKRYKQRLTFHPCQCAVLSSHRESVIDKTIIDLNTHAKIMDLMNLDDSGVMIIHGGSKQDGKDMALKRFSEAFKRLSSSAQKRLVVENCEMVFSIEDLLPMSKELSIPIIVDTHHHNINPGSGKKSLDELIELVMEVWDRRNIVPLFHVSESKPHVTIDDSITARRAHSDYVKAIPDELLQVVKYHKLDIDIEAKCKEKAVMSLYETYGI